MTLAEAAGLHYEEHGGGGGTPPLVFVHGAGGSRLHWPAPLRRFPGRRTLALDLPGHGKSPTGPEGTVAAMAARVADWLEAVGAAPAIMVGHSMGSAIALSLALESPNTVAGMVLIGSGPRLKVNPQLLQAVARPESFPAAVEKIIHWSFASQAEARLVELARRRMLEAGPASLHAALLACDAFEVADRLNRILHPALILVGVEDRMTPPRLSQELAEGIAGARWEAMEAAGHMLMLERPAEVAARIQRFLDTVAM